MRLPRLLPAVVLLAAVVTAGAGCGNSRERGKNQDFDRPKAAEKATDRPTEKG